MSEMLLPPHLVSSAVFRVWRETLPPEVPTIFPGTRNDPSAWSEWFELWVDQWTPRRQRQHAPELLELRVTAHVFVKPSTNAGRVQELVDAARAALNGKTAPIPDPQASDAVLGYVKFGDADVRELTRLDADASRHGLQHHVVMWRGIAQRVA